VTARPQLFRDEAAHLTRAKSDFIARVVMESHDR
jgi:hypothetical protein